MNKKQIRRVVKGYYHELKLYYQQLLPGYGVTSIHQFRVNYKKLRAFLRMTMSREAAPAQMPVTKQLKATYRLCGSIRDLQLHRRQLQNAYRGQQRPPGTYLLHLKQQIALLKKELRAGFAETIIAADVKKTMRSLPDSFSKKQFHRYVKQQQDAVRQLVNLGKFTDTNIHQIRKLLKDLYYNINATDAAGIAAKKEKLPAEISQNSFNSLLDELGKFQDLATEIRLLNAFHLKGLPATEKKGLERLRDICVVQKNQLKRNLVGQLKCI